mgnify:CR=1 FL=1
MKKILAILATFGFAITAAFANIELSANLVFAFIFFIFHFKNLPLIIL